MPSFLTVYGMGAQLSMLKWRRCAKVGRSRADVTRPCQSLLWRVLALCPGPLATAALGGCAGGLLHSAAKAPGSEPASAPAARVPVLATSAGAAPEAAAAVSPAPEKREAPQTIRAARTAQPKPAYAGHGLKNRRLLEASVDAAFGKIRSAGRLNLASLPATGLNSPAAREAIGSAAFGAAMRMEPVLEEAAHELKLKYGHEKFEGQSSASAFLRRLLGSAPYNTLYAEVYRRLSASADPAVASAMADQNRRRALVEAIAKAADQAIWDEVGQAEVHLSGRS